MRGPWKKDRDNYMNIEPMLKNKLNLAGEIRIRGRKVNASKRKRQPTPKKAANA